MGRKVGGCGSSEQSPADSQRGETGTSVLRSQGTELCQEARALEWDLPRGLQARTQPGDALMPACDTLRKETSPARWPSDPRNCETINGAAVSHSVHSDLLCSNRELRDWGTTSFQRESSLSYLRRWVGGHFTSGCSPYPAPQRLLRGPKPLLQLLPPCQQPDLQLTGYRWAVRETTLENGNQPETRGGDCFPAGTEGNKCHRSDTAMVNWMSSFPPSDLAKDPFHLQGTEPCLHPASWKPRSGGARHGPRRRHGHSGAPFQLMETGRNSVAAVPTDLRPLPDPGRCSLAPLSSNSQNAAAFFVFKTFKK